MPAGTGSAVIGFMRGRLNQALADYKQKETLGLPLARTWPRGARDLLWGCYGFSPAPLPALDTTVWAGIQMRSPIPKNSLPPALPRLCRTLFRLLPSAVCFCWRFRREQSERRAPRPVQLE